MSSLEVDRKIRTKNQRERDLRWRAVSLVGHRVNLALKDSSVIVNVFLAPFEEKHSVGYRLTPAGKILYYPLSEVELITPISVVVDWLKEAS
jgi:hypothetical protein